MVDSEKNNCRDIQWVRIFAILIVTLVCIEGLSQVFFLVWGGKTFRSLSPYLWSPYGLVRNNPEFTSPRFQINKNGFRNLKDFNRLKPDNTFRVILLGGSVLYSGLANRFLQEEGRVDSSSTIAQYLEKSLSADPALKDMNIEVINAAVNYNRIVEVSAAYLAEYAFWDPDIVIVYGSANNFLGIPTHKGVKEHSYNIQGDHPWRVEFERVVNRQDIASLTENNIRFFAENFASVALLKKITSKVIDKLQSTVQRFALVSHKKKETVDASKQEEDTYFRHYTAFTDAMVTAAERHNQPIVFFWEYFLGDLKGTKTLSPQEESLYPYVRHTPNHRDYMFRMRDKWVEHFSDSGVPFIDPINELREEKKTVFIDYLHYTKYGNKLMAKATHRAISPLIVSGN